MKRILSVLLAVLLLMSLVGCSGSPSDGTQTPDNTVNSGDIQDNEQKVDTEPTDVSIEETVLLDEAGVKITAKSLNMDNWSGVEIKLLIENNSGQDLTIQCRNSSVNGYMVETIMSADVVNEKKANDSLTFMKSDLEACGIETIADMEFSFHIFTTENWDTYLDTPQIKLKTSAADTYTYTFDDSGTLAYEGNGIKIIVKGLSDDESIFGPGIVVYIENNSDKDITVQTRNSSINGFMADTIFSADVTVGKHAVDAITIMSSDLEENAITEIETVELSFHLFDMNTWDTIADTDQITLTF